jgi:hypothetical protein
MSEWSRATATGIRSEPALRQMSRRLISVHVANRPLDRIKKLTYLLHCFLRHVPAVQNKHWTVSTDTKKMWPPMMPLRKKKIIGRQSEQAKSFPRWTPCPEDACISNNHSFLLFHLALAASKDNSRPWSLAQNARVMAVFCLVFLLLNPVVAHSNYCT